VRRLLPPALGALLVTAALAAAVATLRQIARDDGDSSGQREGFGDSIRTFTTEVRTAMNEREKELMAALADDGFELGALPPNGHQP